MKRLLIVCLFASSFIFSINSNAASKKTLPIIPVKGTYDGVIGDQKIILIAEESDSLHQKGFYILNRGKAVEETHSYSIGILGKKMIFRSDAFAGYISGITDSIKIDGTIAHLHKKKKFLFWYQKDQFQLTKREPELVQPSIRFQSEIAKEVIIKKEIKYGRAPGYWTHNPVDDQPYVEVLSKGLASTFKDTDSLDLKLDLYQPYKDSFAIRPLVLFIHGGAFYIGTKQCPTARQICIALAKRGYVVAAIDYRMGFKPKASDVERSGYRAVQDAHAALRYLAHHAKEYKIDPEQVYVAGTSAGAIASLNVAFMDNDERPESVMSTKKSDDLGKIESSGNNYTDKFQIKAVGNMWGAISDINIIDADEKIPVLSIHGTADDIVPFNYDYPFQSAFLVNRLIMNKMYGSKPIHDNLNSIKVKNKLIALDGCKHEPQVDKFDHFNQNMDTILVNLHEFFYEETAPEIIFPTKQLALNKNSALLPFYAEFSRGEFVASEVTGGVKANGNATDLSVIWFKNSDIKQITLYTKNKFDAWNVKTFPVTIDTSN